MNELEKDSGEVSRMSDNAITINVHKIPDEDLIVIRRIQNGDPSSFEFLVEKYKSFVFNVVRSVIIDPSLEEDLAQESFLAAFRGIKNFRGESQFKSWLYRITYNVCLNQLRKKKAGHFTTEIDLSELPDKSIEPSFKYEENELKTLMMSIMKTLPPRYRSLLHLHYYEGLRYEDISEYAKIPLGTVKSHIHRAKEILKNKLEKEGWIQRGDEK